MDRRNALRLALAGAAASAGVVAEAPAIAKPKPTPPPRDVVYRKWSSDADFATGAAAGVGISGGALMFNSAIG
ncbi:MAG TPA: hypothetical protein DGG94_09020, partial [Micromonosporaceae bacterium]|nr:hypothetical protein [Micromonosporaceae bacterium]